ncbi:MAG: phosphate ABC transporter ATP-binding protein [Betaproteobacteria bacterium]|jgi:tungstate transport system ATP-binding protein|nr:phosphate ABC transporter ATP-binding protein [Betaproteobacteria bacterium]MDH5343723.1 phosphate ABC transporter ATP-binding protein [Betaproteobacteria bacterium]
MLPLEFSDLSYAVGDTRIIRGISARIEAGPRTVILGPNGAGKSVLMRLCHGLLIPTGGRITWHGARNGDVRRHQAMVFQRPVMLRRSALANVVYGLELAGKSRRESGLRAMDVLEVVGLAPYATRPARVLSGGEQQRLALARAWALGPEVLFLDEPTANLDPSATHDIENIINAIHASGTKVIMTTHNLGQARRLGDEILFMSNGRLMEHTPIDRFFREPASAEAAAFIKGELPWQ